MTTIVSQNHKGPENVTLDTDTPGTSTQSAIDCLKRILADGGLTADVSIAEPDGSDISVKIEGADAGLLVGPHGHTLDALQYLLTLLVNKHRDTRLRIAVDAAGYRARRADMLTKFAHSLADEVASSGQEAITDPLNALERRIIHTALVERSDIHTYSEGEEPNRYVVVSPRGEGENAG